MIVPLSDPAQTKLSWESAARLRADPGIKLEPGKYA